MTNESILRQRQSPIGGSADHCRAVIPESPTVEHLFIGAYALTFERFDIMGSLLEQVMYTIVRVPTVPRAIHAPTPQCGRTLDRRGE